MAAMKRAFASLVPLLAATLLLGQTTTLPAQEAVIAAIDQDENIPIREEEAESLIEIHRLPSIYVSVSPIFAPPPELSEEAYFNSQELFLKSHLVLRRVIDRLDLVSRFDGIDLDVLLLRLERQISVSRMEGSAVFRIRVTAPTVEEAESLAATLVKCYKEAKLAIYRERAHRHLDALEQEISAQEDKVEDQRKQYHVICKAFNFFVPNGLTEEDASAFVVRHLEHLRQEGGQHAVVDFALEFPSISEARNELRAAQDLLLEMKAQKSRSRIALSVPLEPLTILSPR